MAPAVDEALPVGDACVDVLPVTAAIAALPKTARPVASMWLWGGAGTTSATGSVPEEGLAVLDAVPPAEGDVQAAALPVGVPEAVPAARVLLVVSL